eukprot:TRINITY_DN1493_c0_g5_i1.p1 TRINITY_DN1493_c0_g5~~TRINITY_DN1493_c0_g5_i1.p1  ORF type:complete len:521 (+),score=181.73 TRINITY_DN1493_c0_g5_i1:48-1565(+)
MKLLSVLLLLSLSFLLSEAFLAKRIGYKLLHNRLSKWEAQAKKNNVQLPVEQWFTQRLDHFNAQETRTWQQRYYVNDTFWDGTGPVFVQIGGEGAISPSYVVALQMATYAQQYGALMIALEHRFYGKSQPLPDLSTPNLKFLSSQQALADLAYFLNAMKTKYNAVALPVVSFGCSYPGNLAAWFRLKFPTSSLASVASSAPVQATLDFVQYLEVVDQSLKYFTGQQCDDLIQLANTLIQNLLGSSQGRQKLQTLFNTCTPIESDKDVATFISSVMGNWMGAVQYNDERGNPIDIEYLCGLMLNSTTDPLTTYANISNMFLQQQQASCLLVNYKDSLAILRNISSADEGVGDRQWTYQTCAEFGYFQTTDAPSSKQPFGNRVPLSYYTDLCLDAFDWVFDTQSRIDETNVYYGGNQLPRSGPTNILFVNGNIDPWHSLGVLTPPSPLISTILIDGTAHCANILPAREDDRESLKEARKKTSAQIGSWLEADGHKGKHNGKPHFKFF